MTKPYGTAVLIGRFSPVHLGHLRNMIHASTIADHVMIILGSSNSSANTRTPWDDSERRSMIELAIDHSPEFDAEFSIHEVQDWHYADKLWLMAVQKEVDSVTMLTDKPTVLIGHVKDAGDAYLMKNFKEWDFIDMPPYTDDSGATINATDIRVEYFQNGMTDKLIPLLPASTVEYLKSYIEVEDEKYDAMCGEFAAALESESQIESMEYGMTYLTADSVVIQSGHILLVTRDTYPGKGQLALPGVHVRTTETIAEASIRALRDEVGLKVAEKVLLGSLKGDQVFDNPNRSHRSRLRFKHARTVTHGFFYDLDSSHPLPTKLKAGKGISRVWWYRLCDLPSLRPLMFEDHAEIIDTFIK